MTGVVLGLHEARANWRRNAIFGVILLLAVSTQLFTALATTASRLAVDTYGAAVFGYSQTYLTGVEHPMTPEELGHFNDSLAQVSRSYPWFAPVTAVDLQMYVRRPDGGAVGDSPALSLRAASRNWPSLTPSVDADDLWRTVTMSHRRGPALLLSDAAATRVGGPVPQAVDLFVQPPSASSASAADDNGGDGASPPVDTSANRFLDLPGVPVLGTFSEPNKSLAPDGFISQNIIELLSLGPQPVQVYLQCDPERCSDSLGLVRAAATTVGAALTQSQRIDQIDKFTPLLNQTERDGKRFSLVVVLLGALAVSIVATAFVEVRGPQFAILRTLGASRSTIGLVTLVETSVTAAVVGVLASLAGFAAAHADPDRFNQIHDVTLTHLNIPIEVYLRTIGLTLAVGFISGFLPAVKAYRSVR